MNVRKFRPYFLIVVLCSFFVSAFYIRDLQAQMQAVWSEPIQLSRRASLFTHPTVAADPWGGVHVFWTEATAEAGSPNLIMYTYLDDNDWAEPYDLFIGENWANYDFPYAMTDNWGQLHLVWASYNRLYYSSVPATSATDVRTWLTPQIVVETPRVYHSRIAIDAHGVLHIVYTVRDPGSNVMYTFSTDNGLTWSLPIEISRIFPNDPQAPTEPRLAIDSQDNLHVVWSESHPPEYLGRYVFYSTSHNGGALWLSPVDLSGPLTEKGVNHHINLSIDEKDDIHVVWCGGPDGSNRLYRYLADSGDTWSGPQLIFKGFLGWGGWDTMAFDVYGNVYWAGLLRHPQGFYFSMLEDNTWFDPPQILISEKPGMELLASAHFPQIIVAEGNQIHLVLVEGDSGAVWYMQGQTAYPSIVNFPTPTTMLTITPTATPTPPMPTPTTVSNWNLESETLRLNNLSSFPIILALLPCLLLVVIVILRTRTFTRT